LFAAGQVTGHDLNADVLETFVKQQADWRGMSWYKARHRLAQRSVRPLEEGFRMMNNRLSRTFLHVSLPIPMATTMLLVVGLMIGLRPASVAAQATVSGAGKSSVLAGALPTGATAYVEVASLGRLLEELEQSSYLKLVVASSQFQTFARSPQYAKADAGRKVIETQLGMNLWKAGRELLRDRLGVGLYPNAEGNPAGNMLALVRGIDPKVLASLRERIEPILTLLDEQIDTSNSIDGIKVLSFQGKAFVALGDTWLAAASTRELLAKQLGMVSGKESGSLAEDGPFKAMTADLGSEHLVRAYVNTEILAKARGGRLAPAKVDNPLVSMLVGGIIELAATSPYAGLTLDVDTQAHRFVLASGVAGDSRKLDDAHRVFFSDPAGPGTPAIPQLPGIIGGFTFHLDLASWYRQREQLLEARVLPGFDQFETGIANLLPGRDVGEDVVPLIGKNITLIAVPQDYSHLDGKPGIKLPGFAAILELSKPQEGGDLFQLFFQTLSAVLNLQAREQNRQPWVMQSEALNGVQISFGRYLKKPAGDQLPLVFNFMPASARVDNKFIISSSLGLCRQLVEQLQKPATSVPQVNRNLNIEFHPAALAEILAANRQVFQARAIQQGTESAQAEREFSTLLELLGYFDSVRLSTQVLPDALRVQLEGGWK
jgi:hypothetical protein